jgi:hypothetical protein
MELNIALNTGINSEKCVVSSFIIVQTLQYVFILSMISISPGW